MEEEERQRSRQIGLQKIIFKSLVLHNLTILLLLLLLQLLLIIVRLQSTVRLRVNIALIYI